jgi:hypothetical protein
MEKVREKVREMPRRLYIGIFRLGWILSNQCFSSRKHDTPDMSTCEMEVVVAAVIVTVGQRRGGAEGRESKRKWS